MFVASGNHMEAINSNRLLRLPEVSKLTSLGKSTINLWVAQGRFPAPTPLSATIKVWRLSDVENWIESSFANSNLRHPTEERQDEKVIALKITAHK
jgi:predicted DNA-binding transcriptional regulator AlpA